MNAPKPARSEAKALTSVEIGKLISAANATRWEPFILLALATGAWRGELLALNRTDIDADAGRITVRASLAQTKGTVFLKATKSGRVRVVPLSLTAREALRKQRAMQAADRLRHGAIYRLNPVGAVFSDELGARLTPKAVTNGFARIAAKAGISVTSLHSARHTAATAMITGGVDIKTAASVLGHSNASVTLAVYAHLVEGQEQAGVDLLSERLDLALKPGRSKA